MVDQSNQKSQGVLDALELRQSMLDQISADQKVVEKLSDEELEMVVGGVNVFHDASDHFLSPSTTQKVASAAKEWISRPSNQVAVGAPLVAAGAALAVGFINTAFINKH